MNYKDKVKKAMELIEGDKLKFEVLPNYIHFDYDVKIDLLTEVKDKYNKCAFKVNDSIDLEVNEFVDAVFLEYFDEYTGVLINVLDFPHIKTLQQFEDLYKALTGKELGCE